MFECRQDEKTFWRTMNPARLHALFNAYLRPKAHKETARPSDPAPEERSLAAYFMGGM